MNEKGSVTLFVVTIIMLGLIMMALILDFGLVFVGKKQLQTAADAASLAGALTSELKVEIEVIEPEDPEDDIELVYHYYAVILPEKARDSVIVMLQKYLDDGLMRTVAIEFDQSSDIEFIEDENGHVVYCAVTLKGNQRALLSALWSEDRSFSVRGLSEAKLEFQGGA